MDKDIFALICCKNCNDACLKRPELIEKEAGVGLFFLKKVREQWVGGGKRIKMI